MQTLSRSITFEEVRASNKDRILAERIIRELERPIFLPMGKTVPYDVRSLLSVMRVPESFLILAWKKEKLIGYNIGAPYKNFPNRLKAKKSDVTPIDGPPALPLPDNRTWYHDTIAVTPSERRQGIATAIFNRSLEHAIKNGYTKWAVFLSKHPSSKAHEMYNAHPLFRKIQKAGGFVEGVVRHRGAIVTYRLYKLHSESI